MKLFFKHPITCQSKSIEGWKAVGLKVDMQMGRPRIASGPMAGDLIYDGKLDHDAPHAWDALLGRNYLLTDALKMEEYIYNSTIYDIVEENGAIMITDAYGEISKDELQLLVNDCFMDEGTTRLP